jgi:voltage-gated potassium channel
MGPASRAFTIALVLVSVGIVAYSATTMTSLVMETKFRSVFWKRRMEQKIKQLHDHFIVCGYGRTGRAVSVSLEQSGLPHVIVESDALKVEELEQRDKMLVEGDASVDETLQRAGIERAKGLVATLGDDAENVYVILSARQLNPSLRLVSWASSEEAEGKIRRAGADYVLSPYVMGGKRIANLLTAPHALEFFEHAMGMGSDQDIRIGEFTIRPDSHLVGNSLQGLGLRRDLAVIVIGIRRADGAIIFNPAADIVLYEDDIVIGIGGQEQMDRFRALVD